MAHILLLEDTKNMRDVISDALRFHKHIVTLGYDGRDGLAYLGSEDPLPDLIITDLKMPHIDGLTFIRQVRQHPDWSAIKIIATSGIPSDTELATDAGADSFIVKPFSHDELETIIDHLLH